MWPVPLLLLPLLFSGGAVRLGAAVAAAACVAAAWHCTMLHTRSLKAL